MKMKERKERETKLTGSVCVRERGRKREQKAKRICYEVIAIVISDLRGNGRERERREGERGREGKKANLVTDTHRDSEKKRPATYCSPVGEKLRVIVWILDSG